MFSSGPEPSNHSLPVTALAPKEESSKRDGNVKPAGFFDGRKISIAGLDKPTLLQCLHKHAHSAGASLVFAPFAEKLQNARNCTLTYLDAKQLVDEYRERGHRFFDYIDGIPIKVRLLARDDNIDPTEYDLYNGKGKCLAAVQEAISQNSSPQEHVPTEGLGFQEPQLSNEDEELSKKIKFLTILHDLGPRHGETGVGVETGFGS